MTKRLVTLWDVELFEFELYGKELHGGICISKSRLVHEVKGVYEPQEDGPRTSRQGAGV